MNIKNALKHWLGRHPRLFFPIYKFLAPRHHIEECLFSSEKELVIEGFPRSANTFAVVAFWQAQKQHTPMGHHLHVEAQILEAVKAGKPSIALIRHPDDAIRSLIIRHPKVQPIDVYQRWVSFYTAIEKVKESVVIADFTEVTKDYGKVIKLLNDRFDKSYVLFEPSTENVESVFKEIEEINQQLDGGVETHVARPSQDRSKIQIELPDCAIRVKACALYESLLEGRVHKSDV